MPIEGKYGDVYKDIDSGIFYAHNGEKWLPGDKIKDVALKAIIKSRKGT